jgi:hypothetical protein
MPLKNALLSILIADGHDEPRGWFDQRDRRSDPLFTDRDEAKDGAK